MDAASAPWVVAMGSDDLMRPRGCQDLLDATADPETDLVVGSVLRVNMDTGKKTRWMPTVTLRSRSVTDISQLPDLVRDTIGGFKLYRTQFCAITRFGSPKISSTKIKSSLQNASPRLDLSRLFKRS